MNTNQKSILDRNGVGLSDTVWLNGVGDTYGKPVEKIVKGDVIVDDFETRSTVVAVEYKGNNINITEAWFDTNSVKRFTIRRTRPGQIVACKIEGQVITSGRTQKEVKNQCTILVIPPMHTDIHPFPTAAAVKTDTQMKTKKKPASRKAVAKKVVDQPKVKVESPIDILNNDIKDVTTRKAFDKFHERVEQGGFTFVKRLGGIPLKFTEHRISKRRNNQPMAVFETKDGEISKAVLAVLSRFIAVAKK